MTKDQAITKLFCECPKLKDGREGLVEALVALGLLKLDDWPPQRVDPSQSKDAA